MKFYLKALDENLADNCYLTVHYEGNNFTFIRFDGNKEKSKYPFNLITNWYDKHLKRLSK